MQVKKMVVAVTASLALAGGLTACSGGSSGSDDSSGSGGNSGSSSSNMSGSSSSMSSGSESNASGPFGAACSKIPKSGKGSAKSMAQQPVATAAGTNPLLSTLTTAVKKAGLVDTLNSAQGITVFAPTNAAFDKVPKDKLNALLADKDKLTKVLEGHVVKQKIMPSDLSSGSFTSLAKTKITSKGSDNDYTIDGNAKVVCGNVKTANAKVYLVDSVLMPK